MRWASASNGLAADQVLGGAFGEDTAAACVCLLAASRKLLPQHLPGFALHFDGGDGLPGNAGHYTLAGRAETITSVRGRRESG